MIVVLDTNTIVSALLSVKGAPYQLLQAWEAEKVDVAISQPLLDELARVLGYEKVQKYLRLSQDQTTLFLKSLKRAALFVTPKEEIREIPDDPDDDRVLECAVAAGAKFIISGDKHLRSLKEFRGIVVLSAAEFLRFLKIES